MFSFSLSQDLAPPALHPTFASVIISTQTSISYTMRLLGTLSTLLAVANAYLDVGHLIARQTSTPDSGSDDSCMGAILEVAGSAPYPPSEIVSVMSNFFMTAKGAYDPQCGWQTALPGSLVDDWYSYQGEVLKWYSSSSAELSSALSKCPPGYESYAGPCSASITGLAAVETDPAGSGSGGSGSAGSGSASKNAAAAPGASGFVGVTGVIGAFFLGIVAVL